MPSLRRSEIGIRLLFGTQTKWNVGQFSRHAPVPTLSCPYETRLPDCLRYPHSATGGIACWRHHQGMGATAIVLCAHMRPTRGRAPVPQSDRMWKGRETPLLVAEVSPVDWRLAARAARPHSLASRHQ